MSDTNQENKNGSAETTSAEPNKTVLLGSIAYANYPDYLKFLDGIKPEQAILILMAAARFGFEKGIYSMDESELVNRAIRSIVKGVNTQTSSVPEKPNDTTN